MNGIGLSATSLHCPVANTSMRRQRLMVGLLFSRRVELRTVGIAMPIMREVKRPWTRDRRRHKAPAARDGY
jgi:hypothetical protein